MSKVKTLSENKLPTTLSGEDLPKAFTIYDLGEGELTFIVNAVHSVQIEAKDARVVSDLQTRLVKLLTGQ